jgi:hypothetical protein
MTATRSRPLSRKIPPEPWGWQLRRLCSPASATTIAGVISAAGYPTTHDAINRLWYRDAKPTRATSVTLAALVLVAVGYDPAVLEVEVPDHIARPVLTRIRASDLHIDRMRSYRHQCSVTTDMARYAAA